MTLGILSDTHGLLRPGVLDRLAGVDLIIHAGDIGPVTLLDALRTIAPTVAVRGNVDTAPWCTALPATEVVVAGDARLFVIHNLAQLAFDPAAAGYRAVVYGHSHRALVEERQGVLFLNPGAAGPRRFDLMPSIARVEVWGGDLQVSLIAL